MIFVYIMAFGVIGAILLGPVGGAVGAGIGVSLGATQSNYRRIRQLEKRLDEKENSGE